MSSESYNILYLLMWFILPIIPAFLFFKIIPSRANVSGPFKGLELKLSGAFAGYFILVLTLYTKMTSLIKDKSSMYEVWTVSGRILDNATNLPVRDTANPTITFIPPIKITNGDFRFKILGTKNENGVVEFPQIKIEGNRFIAENLDQLDYSSDKDTVNGKWRLDFKRKHARLTGLKLIHDPSLNPTTNNTISYVEQEK